MEMNNTRRTFLAQLGLAGAAVGVGTLGLNSQRAAAAEAAAPGLAPAAAPAKTPVYPTHKGAASVLDSLTRAKFSQHLNSVFRVTVKDQDGKTSSLDVKLAEAEDARR